MLRPWVLGRLSCVAFAFCFGVAVTSADVSVAEEAASDAGAPAAHAFGPLDWGMSVDQSLAALGAGARRLQPPREVQGLSAEVQAPEVTIGNVTFSPTLFFDKTEGTLKKISMSMSGLRESQVNDVFLALQGAHGQTQMRQRDIVGTRLMEADWHTPQSTIELRYKSGGSVTVAYSPPEV